MKKQIKKATAKRRTNRIIKVAFAPLKGLVQLVLEDVRVSNAEKSKLKKLEIQKQYLKSEAKSKKDILQYKEMLLPSERARLQSELQALQYQIKEIIEKYHLVMGKRSERRIRRFMQCAVLLSACGILSAMSYLMTTGILTVFGL